MALEWVFSLLVPLIGTVLANAMWFVPVKNTLDARSQDSNIVLEPTPFVVTVLNCLGWTIYGFLIMDPFVFAANWLGIPVGLYNTTSYLILFGGKCKHSNISKVEIGLLLAVSFWIVLLLILFFSFQPMAVISKVVGFCTSIITALYYCSPMAALMFTGDFSKLDAIYLPMGVTNMICAFTWALYGAFGAKDIFILIPNSIGTIASIILISLKILRNNWTTSQLIQEDSKL
jgi:solute carrier family 50 protein (sugar transporter)